MKSLGEVLASARKRKGLSLREVQAATEIQNAHLSQIETGTIKKPDLYILWSLSHLYGLDYPDLMARAGYMTGPTNPAGIPFETSAAALRSMEGLTEDQLISVVEFMNQIKEQDPGRAGSERSDQGKDPIGG